MKDRIPLYPGRVTLTPVSGQENTYDMVRADEPTQAGTPLNKSNLLKDTTAALYGLDETATPDIVLQWLGKYNEHWWSLLHGQAYSYYAEKRTPLTSYACFMSTGFKDYSFTFSYSTSVTVNSSGDVSLDSPQTIAVGTFSENGMISFFSKLCSLAPIYLKARNNGNTADVIYYIPADATYYDGTTYPPSGQSDYGKTLCGEYESDSEGYAMYLFFGGTAPENIRACTVSSQIVNVAAGETTYEHSTDRNAYPDSGTVDGITYSYLGVPFEKFPTMPQIEMGSYTGTGTYGSSNPNSLTFSFSPKILYLLSDVDQYLLFTFLIATATHAASRIYNGSAYTLYVTWSENAVSWYGKTSGSEQFNASGNTYYYVAIG